MTAVAHNVNEKRRTNDVLISENVSFSNLLLSDKVLAGLKNSGFLKPSPIQLKAIPLGRCGLDLIVQAKSGTGKTCVFSVIALESICTDTSSTQVLVLAPTREIAVQIWEVIRSIGSAMKGLECHTFIGGLPLQEDRIKLKKCHIAVGSPGRIKQLIETGVLRTENIRMFVLDEADKLLEDGFQDQINWIYSTLPENKQMLALSATYPEYLADHLTAYMRNPTFLRLNISDPALLGIRQYYQSVTYHPLSHVVFEEKCKVLINILSSVSFQQCLVFSNIQTRASNLADTLTNKGWPTACIAGCLDQKDRNHAMAKLKTYKCRILISTDLTARGIDADKVNLVINMDMPKDHETYLHRIGRAGRFGSFGIAVSLVSEGQEKMDMNSIEKRCNTTIHPLPDPLPTDLAKVEEPVYLNDVVSSEVIDTNTRDFKKAFLHKTPGDYTTPSSVVNGDHVDNETNEMWDNEGINKNDTTADRQLKNGVNSRHENSDTKREMTVYDLSDDVKNGLHFLEAKSAADIKEEVEKIKTSYDTVNDNKINDNDVNDTLIENQSLDETSVQPLIAADEITMQATIKSPKKPIAETKSSEIKELNSRLGIGVFQTSVRDSQPFHSFPRINDLNLSSVFKDTIGYKKQENDLTHSFAKQSLDEFRAKFTGYRETPSITIPNCGSEENKELLRKAVCQLQELFDRNIELRIDPGLSENETEISYTGEKLEENKNLHDSSEKQSMNLRDTLKANEQSTESCAGEVGEDIAYMDKIKQVEKVSNTNINNNKDITERMEKTASDKGAIQKQSKSRKPYTNKFAIAYLLEPGSSVFDGDGIEVVESHREDKPLPEYDAKLNKLTAEDPVVDDCNFGERNQPSRDALSDSKENSGIPFQNGAAEQETQNFLHGDPNFNDDTKNRSNVNRSSKPHKVDHSTKLNRMENSAKPHREHSDKFQSIEHSAKFHGVEHSAKPHRVENQSHSIEHSAKSHSIEHSAKSHRVEQYTSDSDSDSSTSSSTDSEDENSVQNNPYRPHFPQNSESDQFKQYSLQYFNTPYQQVPHMPQHFNYQPFTYAYQYPGIHNPWQGYAGLYQNMPRYRDPECSNQQVQSHMKTSYDMQTEYIKAMCKSMKDGHKRSKRSKKKPKTQK